MTGGSVTVAHQTVALEVAGSSPGPLMRHENDNETYQGQVKEGRVREVVRALTVTVYIDTNERTIHGEFHNLNELMICLGEWQDQGLLDQPRVKLRHGLQNAEPPATTHA